MRKGEAGITCSSNLCGKTFHVVCTKAEALKPAEIKSWICPNCSIKAKKGGDNTLTPLRQMSENVTLRKKSQPSTISDENPVTVSTDALQSLSSDVSLMRQSISDMWKFIRERLDDLDSKLSNYDSRIKSLEALVSENALLKVTIANMQQQLISEAQTHLRNELEISGLEETPGENPYHLVMTTALKIGIELHDSDLNYVSRVGPKRRPQENDAHDKRQFQRPLVVSFTRRVKRDEFLKHAKARRSLRNKDIVGQGQGPDRQVYINERLTGEGRRLFRESRAFATKYGFKYCWLSRGCVFLRRGDANEGYPAKRINSEADLNQLLNSTTQPNPETSKELPEFSQVSIQ